MRAKAEAMMDIRTLLDQGRSDAEIAAELELGDEAEDLIAGVRGRQEDGL